MPRNLCITIGLLALLLQPALAVTTEERHSQGVATLDVIVGPDSEKRIEALTALAPDLGAWIIDFAYGDVVSRAGLDLRSRELVTVAALTALGNAQSQLRAHIRGALNAGCKPEEILEVILQMAVYAGFPASLNGLDAARTVFDEQGIKATAAKAP